VSYARRGFGRVGCTGLSIGGRLSLMSSADYVAAMSPAVVTEISPQGKWMFENFPRPSVREPYSGYVALWKDADPDIPILKQAKAEYAKLQRP
jgi:hypothetical protein